MTVKWKSYRDSDGHMAGKSTGESFQRLIVNGNYVGFIYRNHQGNWRAVRNGVHLTVQTELAAKLAVELL